MYKLTDHETIELANFLRTLCRMNMVNDAKRISKMPDGHLSILIQSEKLWETVYDKDDAGADPTVAKQQTRAPIDFSRPIVSSLGADKKS